MKFIYSFAFLILVLFSTQLSFSQTTINIKISKGRTAAYYYTDEFDDGDPPVFLSAKDHSKELNIKQPTLLIDPVHQIPFLIYPGETLTLQVDNEGLPTFTADGNAVRTNELNLFVIYYKKLNHNVNSILFLPPRNATAPKTDLDFQNIINTAKSDSAKRFEFLRSYQKSINISPGFAAYAHDFFKYLYINDVLAPIYYLGVDTDNLPALYTKQVDSFIKEFNCDSCLVNRAYKTVSYHMQHYLIRKFKHQDNRMALYYDTVATAFSGSTRRYLLFTTLKGYLPDHPINYEAKYTAFINEKADLYSDYLIKQRAITNRFKTNDNLKKEIAGVNGERYTLEELLAKYKGYTIYLDFWASWCGPCRANMPFAEKLKAELKGRKIIFLGISIDTNPSNWQKAINDDHMDKQVNYLLLDAEKSAVNKRFKIDAIPRYLIINKDGVVADQNAAQPHNAQLKKTLIRYLDE